MDTKAAFEKWFDKNFSLGCFSDEDREEYKVYCWMAWRDSRREAEFAHDAKKWDDREFGASEDHVEVASEDETQAIMKGVKNES